MDPDRAARTMSTTQFRETFGLHPAERVLEVDGKVVPVPGHTEEGYRDREARTIDNPEYHGYMGPGLVPTFEGWGEPGTTRHMTRKEFGSIPTEHLSEVQGLSGEVRGEHRFRQGEHWDSFVDDIRTNGIQEPIHVVVNSSKVPESDKPGVWISEGNHRLDAAMEAGLSHVPVEVHYQGRAEDEGHLMQRLTDKYGPGY